MKKDAWSEMIAKVVEAIKEAVRQDLRSRGKKGEYAIESLCVYVKEGEVYIAYRLDEKERREVPLKNVPPIVSGSTGEKFKGGQILRTDVSAHSYCFGGSDTGCTVEAVLRHFTDGDPVHVCVE